MHAYTYLALTKQSAHTQMTEVRNTLQIQMPNPFPKQNVKYNSASRAEVPTDPPPLCPTTGPDISRTGVAADLEGGGGVVGVPYPNSTYKSVMKACHAPHYMSSDHPKSAAGKDYKKQYPQGLYKFFRKSLLALDLPGGLVH